MIRSSSTQTFQISLNKHSYRGRVVARICIETHAWDIMKTNRFSVSHRKLFPIENSCIRIFKNSTIVVKTPPGVLSVICRSMPPAFALMIIMSLRWYRAQCVEPAPTETAKHAEFASHARQGLQRVPPHKVRENLRSARVGSCLHKFLNQPAYAEKWS